MRLLIVLELVEVVVLISESLELIQCCNSWVYIQLRMACLSFWLYLIGDLRVHGELSITKLRILKFLRALQNKYNSG